MTYLIIFFIFLCIIHYSFKENCRHYETKFEEIEIYQKDGKILYKEIVRCKKCGKYKTTRNKS